MVNGLKAGDRVVSAGLVQTPQRRARDGEQRSHAQTLEDAESARKADLQARMKSFTDLFIRRPVLAIVVNLVILIAGFSAIRSLTVRQYPRSENATVTVTTVYVGASADLVRGFVTQPLERAIAAADGIEYLQSSSALGLSTITARLKLNYDANKALSEINSKVNQVRNDLPPEAEVPIINIESADSQFAAAYLSFTSDILEPNQITDYLVRIVQPRLTALEGVQRADILGGRTFAMRIWLKPDRLAAFNISPNQIRLALAANNFLSAVGHTKGSLIQVNLTANTDLRSVDEFKNLVIRRVGDNLVRLSDVADVSLGAEDYDTEVRFSGEHAVFMGVWALPNANSLDVIKRVNKEMASIQKDLPSGLQGRIAYDATKYISDAIHEVIRTLTDHAAHRFRRHIFISRLAAVGADSAAGDSHFAHRRGVSDAGFGLHAEPADAAGDRAGRRAGGG